MASTVLTVTLLTTHAQVSYVSSVACVKWRRNLFCICWKCMSCADVVDFINGIENRRDIRSSFLLLACRFSVSNLQLWLVSFRAVACCWHMGLIGNNTWIHTWTQCVGQALDWREVLQKWSKTFLWGLNVFCNCLKNNGIVLEVETIIATKVSNSSGSRALKVLASGFN